MMSAEVVQLIPENLPRFKNEWDDEKPVLMEPGTYDFVLASYWKGYLYGKAPKLGLEFRVTTPGLYYGRKIRRWYNIAGLTKRGEIIPKGWTSDFVKDYVRLFGLPKGNRSRNIGIRKFKNKVIRGTVRTVASDNKQQPLPKELYYSVIEKLTEVVTG